MLLKVNPASLLSNQLPPKISMITDFWTYHIINTPSYIFNFHLSVGNDVITTWTEVVCKRRTGTGSTSHSQTNLISGLKHANRGLVITGLHVKASNLIITIIWLLPVIRFLSSCKWARWFFDNCRASGSSESWARLLLLDEVGIVQHAINLTGRARRWNIRCCLPSPHPPPPLWFVALQGHGGDESVSESDSFTASSFLASSISQEGQGAKQPCDGRGGR